MADDTVVNFPRDATATEIFQIAAEREMDFAVGIMITDGDVSLLTNLGNRAELYFILHAAAQEILDES